MGDGVPPGCEQTENITFRRPSDAAVTIKKIKEQTTDIAWCGWTFTVTRIDPDLRTESSLSDNTSECACTNVAHFSALYE